LFKKIIFGVLLGEIVWVIGAVCVTVPNFVAIGQTVVEIVTHHVFARLVEQNDIFS